MEKEEKNVVLTTPNEENTLRKIVDRVYIRPLELDREKHEITLKMEYSKHDTIFDVSKTPHRVKFKELLEKETQVKKIPLEKISLEELIERKKTAMEIHRKVVSPTYLGEIPQNYALFIYKKDEQYWVCNLEPYTSVIASKLCGEHLCSTGANICGKMISMPEEAGGCAKVYNRSNDIEKYPWITEGYETIACRDNCFVVLECEHHC